MNACDIKFIYFAVWLVTFCDLTKFPARLNAIQLKVTRRFGLLSDESHCGRVYWPSRPPTGLELVGGVILQ